MEDSFEQQTRIAELLAETEALDWDLDWDLDRHPDAPSESDTGWLPDRHVDVDPSAGADPGEPGATGLEGTDPVVRRWRIEQIVAARAEMARLQAVEARHLAALSDTVETHTEPGVGGENLDWAFRSLTAELAVACRVSSRTMQSRLGQAHLLVNNFPATLQALQSGQIEAGHVRTIMLHGGCIEEAEARARYEGIVVQQAALVTPGRLAKHAQLTAARVADVTFQDRHKKAKEARWVRLYDEDDGMAKLTLYVSKLLGAAIWDRLTQQAKAIHNDNVNNDADSRTFDQIRTDLATELLLTGQPSGDPDAPHQAGIGIRAEVSVVIPVMSLLGRPRAAGSGVDPPVLAGGSPIGMDDAIRLAGDARQWVRVLTDPVTGMVLNVDNYRPSKRLRKFLQIRDGRCRFPVCNRAPQRTEIDHTFAWEFGGKTTPDNLECLCKGEHLLKHQTAWKVRQVSPGVLEWTSPLGQIITDQPDSDIPGATAPF